MSLLEFEQHRDYRSSDAIRKTADLMIGNVENLVGCGAVDWDFILGEVREEAFFHNDAQYMPVRGKGAIARRVSTALASLLSDLGVGLNSPEAVYLSGDYFVNCLGARIASYRSKLSEIDLGARTFDTEEAKVKVVEKSSEMVARLECQHRIIKNAIGRLAGENFPEPQMYAKVLHQLFFNLRQHIKAPLKTEVLELFKQGKVVRAYNKCFPSTE